MTALERLKAESTQVLAKLRWPNDAELAPYIQKLIANSGSVVVIAIEAPLAPEGPRIARGWLSSAEREAVRKALQAINRHRAAKGQRLTTQEETAQP